MQATSPRFVTIINDCRDDNAFARQAVRAAALIGVPVVNLGVKDDLEAAGNLIDALDAAAGAPGVILVNVAPRHGHAKRWPNGTPFAHFRVGATVVVASIDGLTLSLAKKLGLATDVRVMDIPTVAAYAKEHGLIDEATRAYLGETQFRSFEFLPRAGAWLAAGHDLPAERLDPAAIADAPSTVWWVDNFGNCKTTLLPEEAARLDAPEFAELPRYARLKDVPNGEAAVIAGSSGLGERRLLEIVVQGASAAERFSLASGARLTA
jgi:hypothetical protein